MTDLFTLRRRYHRGLTAAAIPMPARVLASADSYHAMLEPRPHRAALSGRDAERELRAEVQEGRLDAAAADAVLASAGHRRSRHIPGPAGLTPREVEVLTLLGRGASNGQIATILGITPKTAGNHIEHVYAKSGVTTRTAAALFAMRHGLLHCLDPVDRLGMRATARGRVAPLPTARTVTVGVNPEPP